MNLELAPVRRRQDELVVHALDVYTHRVLLEPVGADRVIAAQDRLKERNRIVSTQNSDTALGGELADAADMVVMEVSGDDVPERFARKRSADLLQRGGRVSRI